MASTVVTPAETVVNLYRKKIDGDTKFRDDVALERGDVPNASSRATSIGQRRLFMNSCGVDDDEMAHLRNEENRPKIILMNPLLQLPIKRVEVKSGIHRSWYDRGTHSIPWTEKPGDYVERLRHEKLLFIQHFPLPDVSSINASKLWAEPDIPDSILFMMNICVWDFHRLRGSPDNLTKLAQFRCDPGAYQANAQKEIDLLVLLILAEVNAQQSFDPPLPAYDTLENSRINEPELFKKRWAAINFLLQFHNLPGRRKLKVSEALTFNIVNAMRNQERKLYAGLFSEEYLLNDDYFLSNDPTGDGLDEEAAIMYHTRCFFPNYMVLYLIAKTEFTPRLSSHKVDLDYDRCYIVKEEEKYIDDNMTLHGNPLDTNYSLVQEEEEEEEEKEREETKQTRKRKSRT